MRNAGSRTADPLAGYTKGQVPRHVRERHIIAVAEQIFAERGYEGTSLQQVARRAAVTRQYLSKLFGDKEGLYLACHERARAQLNERLAAAGMPVGDGLSAEEAHELLRRGVLAYFTFVRDHGAGWDVLFSHGVAASGRLARALEQKRNETIGILASMLLQGAPEHNPMELDLFAHALSGAGNEVAKWWRKRQDIDLEALAEAYVTLFWYGLVRQMP